MPVTKLKIPGRRTRHKVDAKGAQPGDDKWLTDVVESPLTQRFMKSGLEERNIKIEWHGPTPRTYASAYYFHLKYTVPTEKERKVETPRKTREREIRQDGQQRRGRSLRLPVGTTAPKVQVETAQHSMSTDFKLDPTEPILARDLDWHFKKNWSTADKLTGKKNYEKILRIGRKDRNAQLVVSLYHVSDEFLVTSHEENLKRLHQASSRQRQPQPQRQPKSRAFLSDDDDCTSNSESIESEDPLSEVSPPMTQTVPRRTR